MNRLLLALTLSVSLFSLAGVTYLLVDDRRTSLECPDLEHSKSRNDETRRRLSDLAEAIAELRRSDAVRTVAEEGARTASTEGTNEGQRESSADPSLIERLDTIESRLSGLEGDPVHRALSYIDSGNAELRRQGVERLASLAQSDPDARAALREMLDDGDVAVRVSALKALAEVEDSESALFAAELLDDENAEVRRQAIRTLTELGAKESAAEIASFIDDEDDEVRRQAADAMGKLKYGASAEALMGALEDPNIGVRGEAISSLGEIGAKDSLPKLRELYAAQENGEHREDDQRVSIAMAMKQLGDASAVQAEIKRLGNLVHYDDHQGAMRALMYVGRGEPAAMEHFARAAEASNVEWVRREAQRMLEPQPQEQQE